jgi:alanine racemase
VTVSGRATALTVDLGAIRRNANLVATRVGVPVHFVVKANAYGHGAARVAAMLATVRPGSTFVVARPEEGFELRNQGLAEPILVLGTGLAGLSPVPARELAAELGRLRLSAGVASAEELALWLECAGGSTAGAAPVTLHLKVDTGLGRAGLEPALFPSACERVARATGLRLGGVFTHLAESELLDSDFTILQLDRFDRACAELGSSLGAVPRHVANSAAALHCTRSRYDAVRVGGALYGVDLSAPDSGGELELAMRVVARVVQLKRLRSGDSVGYGRRYRAREEREIALLPVGYADGLASTAAGGAWVLVRGRRAPVVGAISMDLTSVDVTGLGVQLGDEAVILGDQEGQKIGVAELALWSGSPPYECLCRLSRRIVPTYEDLATGVRSTVAP